LDIRIILKLFGQLHFASLFSGRHSGPGLGQPLAAAVPGQAPGETPGGVAGPPGPPRALRHGGHRPGPRRLHLGETLLGGPGRGQGRLVHGRGQLHRQQKGADLREHGAGLLGPGLEERPRVPGVHDPAGPAAPRPQAQAGGRVRGLRGGASVLLRREGPEPHLHAERHVHGEDRALLLPVLLRQSLRHHRHLPGEREKPDQAKLRAGVTAQRAPQKKKNTRERGDLILP